MELSNSNSALDELSGMLRKYVGKRVNFDENTRLYHDLGLYGDDAWELFYEISKKFNAWEPKFDIGEYFPGEGESPFWFTKLIYPKVMLKWQPLTLKDIAERLADK